MKTGYQILDDIIFNITGISSRISSSRHCKEDNEQHMIIIIFIGLVYIISGEKSSITQKELNGFGRNSFKFVFCKFNSCVSFLYLASSKGKII